MLVGLTGDESRAEGTPGTFPVWRPQCGRPRIALGSATLDPAKL